MSKKEVVLAFSGGLDTSFCVPYLRDQGYDVVTLLVDTGGFDDAEKAYIANRARELGAVEHVVADAGDAIWTDVVIPLIHGGQLYQGQYPLLCSDRYIIVRRSLELCQKRGTRFFAHGCTGMGNDRGSLRSDRALAG
ncbi:MAG: argininosuccinate synthase [Polyangiaceae bacterium]